MTPEDVVAAFALPGTPSRPTRIHKVDLIEAVVDRLDLVATLSPATIGVAAGANAQTVQLLTLAARVAPTLRSAVSTPSS